MNDPGSQFRRAFEALLEKVPDPPPFEQIALSEVRRPLVSRMPAWLGAVGGAAVALLLVGGVTVLLGGNTSSGSTPAPGTGATTITPVGSTGPVQTTTPAPEVVPGYVFGTSLPWTLVFDNGYDVVKAVDLNEGIPHETEIPGGAAGDQPYRLTLVDGKLVVGWGEIYAYDIATGQSTLLGEATIYVPAAEPGRVWLVDSGSSYPASTTRVWQVSVDGEQLTEPVTIAGGPKIGIPGGLALGNLLWDLDTQAVFRSLGAGTPSDSTSDGLIAWCDESCNVMHVTDIGSGDDLTIPLPEGEPYFSAGLARFSADGRYLAAPTSTGVVVADVTTGESWTAIDFGENDTYFTNWAPNGTDLFASRYSYGMGEMGVAYHDALTRETVITTLPYGGTLDFVVIPTSGAGTLVRPEPFVCPVTVPTPSGFLAPDPWPTYFPSDSNQFWYGTEDLWTVLPIRPGEYEPRKSVWWSANFPGGFSEENPDITVTWRRLDVDRPDITETQGTNAHTGKHGWFMIAGIDPQEPGCWEVTASYKGATRSYVYDTR